MFFPDAKVKGRCSGMEAIIMEKLKILAESAKFDVSCSSSGSRGGNMDWM